MNNSAIRGGFAKGGGSNATPTVELLGGVLQFRAFHKAQFVAADSESDGANVRKSPQTYKDAVSVSEQKDQRKRHSSANDFHSSEELT